MYMVRVQDCLKNFRNKMGVSNEAPINLKECLKKLNILVMFKDMTDDVKGVSLKDDETGLSAILINSRLSIGKQHETIAHELFHILYDEELGTQLPETEVAANEFASHLLLPSEGMNLYVDTLKSLDRQAVLRTILVIENRYRISRELLLQRITQDHLCSDEILEWVKSVDAIESAEKMGYSRKLYLSSNKDVLISDYRQLANNLFDNNKISEGHYTELINLIGNGED